MENLITRYRNTTILVMVVFAQVLALAVQVKRPNEVGSTRLIRLWVVETVTPLERAVVNSSQWVRGLWGNYLYLRGVRNENRALRGEIEHMRVEQVRLREDASQARRLQSLLGFKEQFISQTMAAQVIGSSGSDLSRVIYIDKGSNDGVKPDMAVITPDGIFGKVLRVFHHSSQVLEINDASSGVGAILEKSRLQGILQGTASGDLLVRYVMSDERVEPGERVLTSGGDRIFPKGLPIGTVVQSSPGSDLFLTIRVKPAVNLSKVEEVLVVTKVVEKGPDPNDIAGPIRAADILAQRLPSVPQKPAAQAAPAPAATAAANKPAPASAAKPPAGAAGTKPASAAANPANAVTKPTSSPTKPATAKPSGPAGAEPNPPVLERRPPAPPALEPTPPAATPPKSAPAPPALEPTPPAATPPKSAPAPDTMGDVPR